MKHLTRTWVPVLLGALAAAGLWLVFTGGADDSPQDDTGRGASEEPGSGNPRTGDTTRLDIDGTDMESVSRLAGLSLPPGTEDFLSARMDDDSQLDVTFTIAQDDETAFVEASSLPEPRAGRRVITHASPVWELNVEGTIRGASDTVGDVRRAIELVEGAGRTRVRLVLTPVG